jgi:hypothetical protein
MSHMTNGDSARTGGGASRRATPARRRAGDSPEVAESRGADAVLPDGESKYARAAPSGQARNPSKSPPTTEEQSFDVRVEFVVLDGPAGKALRRHQAQVMRKVLRWIAEHPDTTS